MTDVDKDNHGSQPDHSLTSDRNPFSDSAAVQATVVDANSNEVDPDSKLEASERDPLPQSHASGFQGGQYNPEFAQDARGNITSQDGVLNSSPEALLQFIDEQAMNMSTRPLIARIRGTTRKVDCGGRARVEEDFNVTISVQADIEAGIGQDRKPLVYTVGDWETVKGDRRSPWRAEMGAIRLPDSKTERSASDVWKHIKDGGSRVAATGYQAASDAITNSKLAKERAGRVAHGSPAFVHPGSLRDVSDTFNMHTHRPMLFKDQFVDFEDVHTTVAPALWQGRYSDADRERSRRAEDVRAAVEDYCASKHCLKQLVVTCEYYGWDWTALKAGIEASVLSTFYAGQVWIEFDNAPTTITLRAPGWPGSILLLPLHYKVPLSLTLVYPSIVLAACTAPRVDTLRIAVPLARWLAAPTSVTDQPEAEKFSKQVNPAREPKVERLQQDGAGAPQWIVMVGLQEGEWLKKWEKPLAVAVMERTKGGALLKEEDAARQGGARAVLRGYIE